MLGNRTLWIVSLVFAGTILACIGVGGSATLPTGEPAPIFGVRIGGKIVALDDLQGNAVVVNFWSSG
jgi:hypothetical protein